MYRRLLKLLLNVWGESVFFSEAGPDRLLMLRLMVAHLCTIKLYWITKHPTFIPPNHYYDHLEDNWDWMATVTCALDRLVTGVLQCSLIVSLYIMFVWHQHSKNSRKACFHAKLFLKSVMVLHQQLIDQVHIQELKESLHCSIGKLENHQGTIFSDFQVFQILRNVDF